VILRDNLGVRAILSVLPDELQTSIMGDAVLVTSGSASGWWVRPVWVGEGFPADVADVTDVVAALDLKRPRGSMFADLPVTPVVTARRISKGTRRTLDAAGLSWADLTGRGRIAAEPGLFVYRDTPRTVDEAAASFRWSRSAGAVAETILHGAIGRAGSGDLIDAVRVSELAAFSYAQVNKVLQDFEAAGYIAKSGAERGSGAQRRLVDPSRLLSDWAGWHRGRLLGGIELNTPWRSVDESLGAVRGRATGPWAVSGWYAADIIAPFSTSVPTLSCYVDSAAYDRTIETLVEEAGWDVTAERGRVSITPAEPHVLRLADERKAATTVSPIRVYGDLVRIAGRGEDAAQHLREESIGY
jgi:hypothetical protein